MQDRVPLYPGRIILTPVAGQANTYDMVRADQPTQDGTPLNKATFWKDATAALFGLGVDSVPDDGFSYLGKYAQYWWRRRSVNLSPKLSDSTATINIIYTGGQSTTLDVPYSSSIIIHSESEFDLDSAQQLSVSYNTHTVANALKGKYFRTHRSFGGESISEEIYFLPENAGNVSRSGSNPYFVTCSAYTVGVLKSYGNWGYVQSSDRSAYPDSGEQDGYEYEYLGIPFDNAVGAPKVEVGGYTGTGAYSSSSPNSLTFGFKPKLLLVSRGGEGFDSSGSFGWLYGLSKTIGDFNDAASSVSLSGRTISWYNTYNAQSQRNLNGVTYYYVAIG